jgi:serralysin
MSDSLMARDADPAAELPNAAKPGGQSAPPADTVPGDLTTTVSLNLGAVDGYTDVLGDRDWYRVQLVAGQTYTFFTAATGGTTDIDTDIYLRSADGTQLRYNDDSTATYSRIRYTATTTGVYYLDVGAFENGEVGEYRVGFEIAAPLTVYTLDQIAHQLSTDYWGGAGARHFDVRTGGEITVNITGLTDAGQFFAREALSLWADASGLRFSEVSGGEMITFDDDKSGASTSSSRSGQVITHASINVATQWITDYGSGLRSYALQAYIHEIGHALGLGHAGGYNTIADYATDATYLNDSWAVSIMSYFDQAENTYFANQGFTRQLVLTPMLADVLAVNQIYGVPTATRLGDTVYGFNNTAGQPIFDPVKVNNITYTIVDSGGIDTLDYSGYAFPQTISLNWETFSNVGGRIGNVTIARGTLIENAIGGSANDILIGNSVSNLLIGGEGDDTLEGAAGADRLIGGLGNDTYFVDQQGDVVFEELDSGIDSVTTKASFYLYSNLEILTLATGAGDIFGVGNELTNTIIGNEGSNLLIAGSGDDEVRGGGSRDAIFGQDGSDSLFGDSGTDYIVAGAGNDNVDGGDGPDEVYGQEGDDNLSGGSSFDTDILVGGIGNDVLHGDSGQGDYDFLYGNDGDDVYFVDTPADLVFEQPSEGIDTVYASITGAGYYLYDNVENLTLFGATPFGVGNALDNRIIGSALNNYLLVLDGRGGNDVLFGQVGKDVFTFYRFANYDGAAPIFSSPGQDVIADFEVGIDRIRFVGVGITSFAQVQSAFSQVGVDGAINFGNGEFVVLQNVVMSQLSAADFIFG